MFMLEIKKLSLNNYFTNNRHLLIFIEYKKKILIFLKIMRLIYKTDFL